MPIEVTDSTATCTKCSVIEQDNWWVDDNLPPYTLLKEMHRVE